MLTVTSRVGERRLLHVARDFGRGGALLLDGCGNGGGDPAHFLDGHGNAPDRLDRLAGFGLDLVDLGLDFAGGVRCLAGEALDLRRDHRKTLAGIAGPRRLDGRVQCQQVGLAGDIGDQADDLPNLFGAACQGADDRPWFRASGRPFRWSLPTARPGG